MDYCASCLCRKVYCRGCKSYHCQCLWNIAQCRTAFRKHLNADASSYKHKNGRYEQRTRPYGDYLWHQDRERFEVDFQEFRSTHL